MRFIHKFSCSLQCEVQVTDSPPPTGSRHIINCQWTGTPKPKHVREYVRWINEVNRYLADLWRINMAHVIQVKPNVWEFWAYEPDQPPKLMQTIHDSPNAST